MNDHEYLCVMAKLKFIGSVGDNQYINLVNNTIENKNFYTMVVRKIWYKLENGQSSAKYCRDVIIESFKLLDKYVGLPHMTEYAKTIQKYIWEAKIGIDHLKETHSANTMAYSMFDAITVGILQKMGEQVVNNEEV